MYVCMYVCVCMPVMCMYVCACMGVCMYMCYCFSPPQQLDLLIALSVGDGNVTIYSALLNRLVDTPSSSFSSSPHPVLSSSH